MQCKKCGNTVDDSKTFCPECGSRLTDEKPQAKEEESFKKIFDLSRYNLFTIIGCLVSIISLFLNFWGIVGIAGTIISLIGFVKTEKDKKTERFVALGGVAVGAISILYAFTLIAL